MSLIFGMALDENGSVFGNKWLRRLSIDDQVNKTESCGIKN
jgi:hypothetical protein